MKPILILYHKNCPDGFGAAWAARKKFGNKADYIATDHRSVPKEKEIKNRKEIYMLDICYRRPILEKLLKINPNIIIIDHHITSEQEMKIAKNYFYALNHSGAVLSWKYFHPRKPAPRLLCHIEDVKKRRKYVNEGRLILKYRDVILKWIMAGAEKMKFEKQKVYVVNSPFWQSEIGNYIVKNKKAIGVIWSRKSGKIKVSLRSDGKIDVSKLAEKYGGGGHRAAAGFVFYSNFKFPWKIIK